MKCKTCSEKYCEDCGELLISSEVVQNMFIFFDEGKSIMTMRKENPELFWKSQDWCANELFSNVEEEPQKRKISIGPMKDSFNKTWDEQQKMAKDAGGVIPTARQQLAMMIAYYKKTGIRLFEDTWARCDSRTTAGDLAVVGGFVAVGVVVGRGDAFAHSFYGASLSADV